jgi:hypothetical protein
MVYTAESSGNFWNFDPTRLVINDSVGVCVDGNESTATAVNAIHNVLMRSPYASRRKTAS